MKILLVAVNAKYIHSNLGIYSLASYARTAGVEVSYCEYTINQRLDYIVEEIYRQKADLICFSCYIWNIDLICEVMREYHKLKPRTVLWAGGPEVSFETELFLKEHEMVKGVMVNEGEETFLELCRCYEKDPNPSDKALSGINGIIFHSEKGICMTAQRSPMDMDNLVFCYSDMESLEHRIVYYETSRGCPFSCSYCLSSIEKTMRFRSLNLVFRELDFFLEKKVPQVKFIDRTFNCDPRRAYEIWKYLLEHDNGITNFHFEIAADLLEDSAVALMEKMRPGLIQLEIGIQTTNDATIHAIRRRMDLQKVCRAIKKVKATQKVHQHVDLIAGLPQEGFVRFGQSFDEVYRLYAQQLQLGFLKVLKGSYMYEMRDQYQLTYHERSPYEIWATKWLSYEEVLVLHDIEELLEVYYNSGQFVKSVRLLERYYESPFEMYRQMGVYYRERDYFAIKYNRLERFRILLDFFVELHKPSGEEQSCFKEALTWDC